MPPQQPFPQSNIVYVPCPNPVKEGDDAITAFMKHKKLSEDIEKLFKKEEKKHEPKGLSVKDMWWLMAVMTFPIALGYGGLLYRLVK
jgi:hypothetical protein